MSRLKVDTSLSAKIVVVCGGSGNGKSEWVKRQVKSLKKLVVWDVDEEYVDLPRVK